MIRWLLFVFVSALLATGCSRGKSDAIGGDDQIIVFADTSNWIQCREELRAVFERTFRTPQTESEFFLQPVPLSVFETYRRYKNIVFVGTMDSDGPVSETVRGMLGPDVQTGVSEGQYFVFNRRNEWANGQMIMILAAPSAERLNEAVRLNADELFAVFDEQKSELMKEFLYGTSAPLEDKALEEELLRKYGWTMRIYPDYKLVDEGSERGYVRFHARSLNVALQRWISVYWASLDTAAGDSLPNPAWMRGTRNRIGSWFVDPVETLPEFDRFQRKMFGVHEAWCYTGLWRTVSSDNPFGGVFRAYGFREPLSRRLFFIDQAVFYPEEKKKLKFLRELDIITKTFTVGALTNR